MTEARKLTLIAIAVCTLISFAVALDNGLARTPQMGWNSWNHFGCSVNESVLRRTADLMISTGLYKYGYKYINVDDCWAYDRDNTTGVVTSDPKTFPSGMKALVDYIHSRGLLFGLYSDAGIKTCAGRPGSEGFEAIDAQTYASWGVDYLKYDNCFEPNTKSPRSYYSIMRDALNATGRPILFSLCEWGAEDPWLWGNEIGNSWRTTNDIIDMWEHFLRVLDNNIGLSPFAGPGGWNDLDMLEVGNGGMEFCEYRSQFALWCLLKAPLIMGHDLSAMSNETLFIYTSTEVIAVNQDPLGVQGDLIYQLGPIQIWAGPLADGSRAFVMFNRHTLGVHDTTITLHFGDLGFPHGTLAVVRDLYAKKDLGVFKDLFTASVPSHDVFVGRVIPVHSRPEHLDWRPWHNNFKINDSPIIN